MKYANKLTEEELRELYLLFTDKGAKINELNIVKDDYSIALEGYVEIPEFDEEILKENPNATIVIDDDYELDDFDVKVYHHSGDVTDDPVFKHCYDICIENKDKMTDATIWEIVDREVTLLKIKEKN